MKHTQNSTTISSPRSSIFPRARRWGLACATLAAAVIAGGQASAQIRFDKLTACKEVASLWSRMDGGRTLSPCRQPSGTIETALSGKAFPLGGLCFLAQPPGSFLSGFSCANMRDPASGDYNGLLCFRGTDAAFVARYEDDYDAQHATAANSYVANAAECPGSNGDAAPVGTTMFSTPLKFIAKPEFGFASQRGAGRSGMIVHGYAALDPSLTGPNRAIEVVELFVGSEVKFGVKKEGKTFGAWRVAIDDAEEMDDQVNDMNAKAGMPLWVDFRDLEIARVKASGEVRAGKMDRISDWMSVMIDEFEFAGLERLTDAELRDRMNMSYADFRAKMLANMPFGQRALMDASAGEFHMMFDESLADCTDDGLMMAILTSHAEPSLGASEYGSIGLIMFGLGRCSNRAARIEMADIMDNVTDEFTNHLENDQ